MNNSLKKNAIKKISAVGLFILLSCVALAEPGVTETEIVLGTSNSLTGPNKESAQEFTSGSRAAFSRLTKDKIFGRTIRVEILDDKYDPKLTNLNTQKFIEGKNIFALWDYYGSNQVKTALTLSEGAGLPLLFPHSGGSYGRESVVKTLFHLRPGQVEQGSMLVTYALQNLKVENLGILYEDSDYGKGGFDGIHQALKTLKPKHIQSAKYDRFGQGVEAAYNSLKSLKPDAILLVAVPEPAKQFAALCAKDHFTGKILGLSPAFSQGLLDSLGSIAENSYFIQFLPLIEDDANQLIQEFKADMKAINAQQLTPLALESYVSARILIEGLRKTGAELSREKLIQNLESLKLNIGGLKIELSPTNHQAIHDKVITRGSSKGLQYAK